MDKNKRTLEDLIVRVGDQGPDKYKANVQKLMDTISKDLESDVFKEQLCGTLCTSISKLPNKYFVYAVVVTNINQAQPDFAERLFVQLFELLQVALQQNSIMEASNVMCFFAETVNTGLMNSFTFISLLMEIISVSEKDMDNFDQLIRLVFKSILYVKSHLVEKYEMEFANLMEDVKKNIDNHGTKNSGSQNSMIRHIIGPLTDPSVRPSFRLHAEDCWDLLKNVKPIRQNFKLSFTITGPQKPIATLSEVNVFEQEFIGIRSQSRSNILDEFLIREYIKDSLVAFSENIVLFIEKIFVINFGSLEHIKNFAFMDTCYSILLNPDKLNTSQTFAIIMEMMVKYFNFEIFFESSLVKFSRYLSESIETLSVRQLQTIVTNLALVNYLTGKNYALQLSNPELGDKAAYFNFFQMYKTLKQSLSNQSHPINKADLNK